MKRPLVILALLTIGTVIAVNLVGWIMHNGISTSGSCLNHFGEESQCSFAGAVFYPFLNPVLWPVLVMLFLVWSLVLIVGGWMIDRFRRRKRVAAKNYRSESGPWEL